MSFTFMICIVFYDLYRLRKARFRTGAWLTANAVASHEGGRPGVIERRGTKDVFFLIQRGLTKMNKQRWRNYALWVSVASQALLLIQLLGQLTGAFSLTEIMKQDILTAVDAFLGLLATLGIISNPTKPSSGGYNL